MSVPRLVAERTGLPRTAHDAGTIGAAGCTVNRFAVALMPDSGGHPRKPVAGVDAPPPHLLLVARRMTRPGEHMALTTYTPVITVFAAGREWTLERAADLQTLWDNMVEADFGDDERLPYWTELWPSSLVLADWLHDNAGRIRGRTCLDMGCGLGLCSLVGQWLGARVTGMDYEPEALFHARRNAERNRVPQPLWTVMDWRAPAVRRHAADLVWGGDIMYERRFVTPVLDFLDHVLAPCGAAWVAEPGRTVYNHFRETLDARGWHARRVLSSETASLYEQPESVTVHLWEITR